MNHVVDRLHTVLYVLHTGSQYDGASKSFLTMLGGLCQHGIRPIVMLKKGGDMESVLRGQGIPVLSCNYRDNAYPPTDTLKQLLLFLPKLIGRFLLNEIAYRQLIRFVSGQRVELVHTNVSVTEIGFRVAHHLGVPHVYHIREYGDLDFGYRYFPSRHRLMSLLHAPGCYSICITKDIQRYNGLESWNNSRVIYNGIASRSSSLPSSGSGSYFLYAGRIQHAKGLDLLLDAYSQYVQSHTDALPLYVAGRVDEQDYYNVLLQFINEHDLKDKVFFLGPRSDMPELMRQARALIVPSRHEGFGRCMPEAMFQGCVVIGHDTSGTKEQFANGRAISGNEIGFPYASTDELYQQLCRVAKALPVELQPYRERAFDVVNQLYTIESNVEQTLLFYQDIFTSQSHSKEKI